MSALSERQPLGSLPSIELPNSGEPVLMGRSSNSSHHQLSASRLISRIHVSAYYAPPTPLHASGEVFVECLGWNGAKVHCAGRVYELSKGDTFASDKPSAQIMLDVQDARVLVAWPFGVKERKVSVSARSDETWTVEASVSASVSPARRVGDRFASSPPPAMVRPSSPVSPTPGAREIFTEDSTFLTEDAVRTSNEATVQVYEDPHSGDEEAKEEPSTASSQLSSIHSVSVQEMSKTSQSSLQSSHSADEFSDCDEENDPIIHSFGPYGENILPRLQSFQTTSPQPQRHRRPLEGASSSSPQHNASTQLPRRVNASPIKNHVINQLAFSRIHSMPLSTILGNLPADMKAPTDTSSSKSPLADNKHDTDSNQGLTDSDLKRILDETPCIGEIRREGKDAAGKPLEDEFYYIPEMDQDQMRRNAVTSSRGGTGLRAVRKNHKVCAGSQPGFC